MRSDFSQVPANGAAYLLLADCGDPCGGGKGWERDGGGEIKNEAREIGWLWGWGGGGC